jgi:hypothetical protein
MSLQKLISAPSFLNYDHRGPRSQPAQVAIDEAKKYLEKLVPPGFKITKSGAAQNLPHICWIAVLDLDQTETTQSGIFIVYLYSQDLKRIYLSLNQGFYAHENKFKNVLKEKRSASVHDLAIKSIAEETIQLRSSIKDDLVLIPGLVEEIDLGSDKHLADGYERGHITGFEYDPQNMPSEEIMLKQLDSLYPLYTKVCEFSDFNSITNPTHWTTTSGSNEYKRKIVNKGSTLNFDDFTPKASHPIPLNPPMKTYPNRFKTRKHEDLIRDFGSHARSKGFKVTNKNVGKRDLVMLDPTGKEFLVEAKTVKFDGEEAVRDAIGQLLAYRFEYYEKSNYPEMVALFNLEIGKLWQDLLDDLKIHWIYISNGTWFTSADVSSLK